MLYGFGGTLIFAFLFWLAIRIYEVERAREYLSDKHPEVPVDELPKYPFS